MFESVIFQKLTAIILAFFTGFVTYPLSFCPDNYDSSFEVVTGEFITLNGNKVQAEADCPVDENGTMTIDNKAAVSFVQAETSWFNYYSINYSSDAYIKGEIEYYAGVKRKTEEFFLEPGENCVFSSFTDNCFEGTKANAVVSLSFEPLDKDTASLTVNGMGTFNREIPDKEIYLVSNAYKLGVNLVWGGALSYLEDLDSDVEAVRIQDRVYVDSNASERYGVDAFSKNVNLINRADAGRLVQQSYYGTDDYECGEYMGSVWNYNPVQGGNQFNDSSKIVDLRINEDSIYIKSRPLDWAKEKEHITPSYMEAVYTFENGAVHVECRFVDFSGYTPKTATQELPAFYCIEPLNNFVYYQGENAWENEALSNEPGLIFWPDAGYPTFKNPECWAAFTGEFEDSFGIGVYVEDKTEFLAGVYERGAQLGDDPSTGFSTSYIAVVEDMEIRSYEPVEYDYYLATGSAEEIRNTFAEIDR